MPVGDLPHGIERDGDRYRVRKRLGAGVRIQRRFATLAEAEAFLATLGPRPDPTARHGLTVEAVVRRWFDGRRARLTPGGLRVYEEHIDRYIVRRIGQHVAEDYARTPGLLRAFYDDLPPVCALKVHTILKQSFEEAVDHDLVSRNPCLRVRPNRRGLDRERDIPTAAEAQKIVAEAWNESEPWGLYVYVVATLGLRRAEACALRWEDVDFDARVVRVRSAVGIGWGDPVLKAPKSGKPRTLPVGEPFFERIAPFRRPGGFLFVGFHRSRRGPARRDGEKCWHPSSASHRFERMIERLGLAGESGRPYTLHSLRHYVATKLLVEGMPLSQVARFMGHKTPSITQDLYANHLDHEAMRLVGDAAAGLFDVG